MFNDLMPMIFSPTINVVISVNQQDYDLANAVGNPAFPVNVIVRIQTGVEISASIAALAAFSTGMFVAGSNVIIINDGHILARGGDGGGGGNIVGGSCGNGAIGAQGGDAINTDLNIQIDNTNGNIYGGGGGGGGGGGAAALDPGELVDSYVAGGGGAGGGAGVSAGGPGGTASGATKTNCPGTVGSPGSGGPLGAGAPGGPGGPCVFAFGGAGGAGGGYGVAGASGVNGSVSGVLVAVCSAAVGGAPGKAVELNGNSILWLGGNNPTQVKGAVS